MVPDLPMFLGASGGTMSARGRPKDVARFWPFGSLAVEPLVSLALLAKPPKSINHPGPKKLVHSDHANARGYKIGKTSKDIKTQGSVNFICVICRMQAGNKRLTTSILLPARQDAPMALVLANNPSFASLVVSLGSATERELSTDIQALFIYISIYINMFVICSLTRSPQLGEVFSNWKSLPKTKTETMFLNPKKSLEPSLRVNPWTRSAERLHGFIQATHYTFCRGSSPVQSQNAVDLDGPSTKLLALQKKT